MKVYDLLTGTEADLPCTDIASGRYRLLEPCLFNGEVRLSPGAILWRLGEVSASLAPVDQSNRRLPIRFIEVPGSSAASELVDLSIAAVIESWPVEADAGQLPSPLLPAVLRDRMQLQRLETELERALGTGQWDEISARPRLDMHYVSESLPVARVKRVQSSAVEHLSQHSELWARRSISGVIPSKVLARVAEDDFSIYENVVFARLLDTCAYWLNRRIAEVRTIADGQSTALKFEKSDERQRLLRDRICALWGKAWFNEAEDSQTTRQTLEHLEKMRQHVERLRRTGVYRHVPRSAKVPLRLRATNIFQFDKRYRELRSVWDHFASASATDSATWSDRYQSMESKQAAFCRYVLLVLCHALRDMGASGVPGSQLGFSVGPWEIQLEADEATEIRIKVLADGAELRSRTLVLLLTKEQAVVGRAPLRTTLYAEDLRPRIESEQQHLERDVLNPFQFFSVERVRQILEQDLCELFLDQYPPTVGRVPRPVCAALIAGDPGVFRARGDGLVVLPSARTPDSELFRLVANVSSSAPRTERQLRHGIRLSRWLVRCRACGVSASGQALRADERALRLLCPSCRLETTLSTSPTRSMRSRFQDWGSGFELCGGVEVALPREENRASSSKHK